MRKNIFLSVILSLCVANFGAFAANQRGNARATNNANATQQQSSGAPVAARAAARNTVKNSGVSTAKPAATSAAAPVSARAANRQQVVSNNAGKKTAAAPAAAPKANGARAAATQKVINNGTKVATATTNTVVSQECQDAFFGCMDSFCMLDNASGGRCTCSDRNEDLKKVMDDIALLDEQSYAMATEGVERIKMGENADDIIARAKSAGDKAAGKAEKTDDKTKVRSLDLNAWNSGIFSEDDDIFDGLDMSVDSSAVSSALSKSGDALYVSSAKMCLGQMPTQCSGSVQMLQNIYAQKIKSDCMAFENSLKQQKIASTQKLQTAEKALRDAALEQFQSENKMDLGECTIAFKECMKTTAGCGEDWTGCVGITAAENAKNNNSKQTSIKGKYANITLGAASLQTLTNKKALCESVTKQCVNESDRVWETFLAEVAPEIKTAELLAEDKLRTNCLTDVADCFKDACGAKFDPEQDGNDFDLCLS
nr:hypothetical protein [Candidatus Enterousia merdequi]